jgi:NADP-dependent 3-hydroxy acid dehydrogenase YdfG
MLEGKVVVVTGGASGIEARHCAFPRCATVPAPS